MKKWTYLVAAGMLLGAAPVFTGCIDNDEPEGINLLRKAKAELISAKKAVVEAEASRLKAEEEFLKAQAEVQKAEAEIKKAEAAIKQAQADQIKAETEAEKAKLEAIIKKLEAEAKEAEARAQQALTEAEAAAQKAKDDHEYAMKQLEILNAQLTGEQQKNLQFWMDIYDEAKKAYDEAYLDWVQKSRAYTAALADDQETGKDPQTLGELEWAIKVAEKNLAERQADQAYWENELKEAEAIEISELQTKKEALQEEAAKAKDAVAQVGVKKAELRRNNADKYEAVDNAEAALVELEKAGVEIAPFKYVFPEIGIPGYVGEFNIIGEGITYTMNRYKVTSPVYDQVYNLLTYYQEEIRHMLLDEDDKAWTEARINQMTAERPAIETTYKADLANWEKAVAAFNSGKEVLLNKYDGYAELGEAIEAYNAAGEASEPLRQAYEEAYAAFTTAQEALINIPEGKDAEATYRKEEGEAATTRDNAIKTAEAAYTQLEQELMQDIQDVTEEMILAWKILDAANTRLEADPTNKEYQKAVEDANKALADLQEKMNKTQQKYHKETREANEEKEKAIASANADYIIAEAEAMKKYRDTVKGWGGSTIDPSLQEAFNTAADNLTKASDAYQEVKEAVINALWDVNSANVDFRSGVYYYDNNTYNNYMLFQALNNNQKYIALDFNTITSMTTNDAEQVVKLYSQTVYGMPIDMQLDSYYDSQYGIPAEHLLPRTKADIDNMLKEAFPYLENYQLAQYYSRFGSFGALLDIDNSLTIAKAYRDNNNLVDEAVAGITEAIEALEAGKAEQELNIETALANIEAAYALIEALEEPLELEAIEAKAEYGRINAVLRAVMSAINNSGTAQWTQAEKDNMIDNIEMLIEANEEKIHNAEVAVEVANKRKADYEAGDYSKSTEAKYEMEDAEYKMNEAKAEMEKAKEDLDEQLAKLEEAE